MTGALHLRGMHGLGDNLHQRAVIRQLLARGHDLWLETPWPCVYHDLAGDRLHLVDRSSPLRTQRKNAVRERARFSRAPVPRRARILPIGYGPEAVRRRGSVLGAMCERAGVDIDAADFRLPVPAEWDAAAKTWLDRWQPDRALLLYRPLNERKEWGGCAARNPDYAAYAGLLASVRERFFVVSIADFAPGQEWPVGIDIKADVECHRGELSFEVIAALARRAGLVWSSPGFMVILAQAVGTASVCVFGGYEDCRSFSAGARFAPHLGIEPVKPCACFKHDHSCDKTIDLPAAHARLATFLDAAVG